MVKKWCFVDLKSSAALSSSASLEVSPGAPSSSERSSSRSPPESCEPSATSSPSWYEAASPTSPSKPSAESSTTTKSSAAASASASGTFVSLRWREWIQAVGTRLVSTSRSASSPEVTPPSSSPDNFLPPRLTYLGRYRLNLPLPLPSFLSLSSSSASSFSSSPLSPFTDLLPPLPPRPRPLKLLVSQTEMGQHLYSLTFCRILSCGLPHTDFLWPGRPRVRTRWRPRCLSPRWRRQTQQPESLFFQWSGLVTDGTDDTNKIQSWKKSWKLPLHLLQIWRPSWDCSWWWLSGERTRLLLCHFCWWSRNQTWHWTTWQFRWLWWQ